MFVWECEWESLAALEAHYMQEVVDPDLKALNKELSAKLGEVYDSVRREMVYIIPWGDTEGQ